MLILAKWEIIFPPIPLIVGDRKIWIFSFLAKADDKSRFIYSYSVIYRSGSVRVVSIFFIPCRVDDTEHVILSKMLLLLELFEVKACL